MFRVFTALVPCRKADFTSDQHTSFKGIQLQLGTTVLSSIKPCKPLNKYHEKCLKAFIGESMFNEQFRKSFEKFINFCLNTLQKTLQYFSFVNTNIDFLKKKVFEKIIHFEIHKLLLYSVIAVFTFFLYLFTFQKAKLSLVGQQNHGKTYKKWNELKNVSYNTSFFFLNCRPVPTSILHNFKQGKHYDTKIQKYFNTYTSIFYS